MSVADYDHTGAWQLQLDVADAVWELERLAQDGTFLALNVPTAPGRPDTMAAVYAARSAIASRIIDMTVAMAARARDCATVTA